MPWASKNARPREWRRPVTRTKDLAFWRSENDDRTATLVHSCSSAWAARARTPATTCRTRTSRWEEFSASRAHNLFRTKILLTPNAAQRTTTASLCVDSAVLLTTAQKNQAGGTLPTEASGLTKEKNLDTKSEFDLFFSLTANYAAHSITATNLVKSE